MAWLNVDLDAGHLEVKNVLNEVNGKLKLKEPKTKSSRRRMDLPRKTVEALRKHRQQMIAEGLGDNLFVFTNEHGEWWRRSHCLVYDLPLGKDGLLWKHLVGWWAKRNGLEVNDDTERGLYRRLAESLSSPVEKSLFCTYFKVFRPKLADRLPALIPQVYLHYDPYTIAQLGGDRRLPRQRMDFLLLLSPFERIVIEVDGKQHYSDGDQSSPSRYAEMVQADRDLRLSGYEVYRFGGVELSEKTGESAVTTFFHRLFQKHRIGPVASVTSP